MAEYIEREAVLALKQKIGAYGMDISSAEVKELPTADVVDVRHGEWIYHECVSSHDGAISGFSCSQCSAFVYEDIFDMDEFNKGFCGACGAKMDGKGEG